MISPTVLSRFGEPNGWMPVNVCCHCGETDSPEDAKHWPTDDDGDRICPPCAKKAELVANTAGAVDLLKALKKALR